MKLPTEWKIMACMVGQEGSDAPLIINLGPLHPTPHQTSMCEDTCPGFISVYSQSEAWHHGRSGDRVCLQIVLNITSHRKLQKDDLKECVNMFPKKVKHLEKNAGL